MQNGKGSRKARFKVNAVAPRNGFRKSVDIPPVDISNVTVEGVEKRLKQLKREERFLFR
jgi:hypothetical protein